MKDFKNWLIHTDNHITTLQLNRPDKLNSLTPNTLHELRDISNMLADDTDTWAVVVEGVGSHFSAGVDVNAIGAMVGQGKDVFATNIRDLQDCLDTFEALPKPTIAKIRGHCIGGGMILALCCDFRYADDSAMFWLPEVRLGIAVIMGTQRITRTIGTAATKELVMMAEKWDSIKAERTGLIHGMTDADNLDALVADHVAKFQSLPPRTISIARRIIDEGASMTLRDSQELEIALQADLLSDDDFSEGVQAFFEKRPPKFQGK
ncbi:MAG: enoyl-CoA hydratase/isomerase family protein [Aggregatilineales bacterium]